MKTFMSGIFGETLPGLEKAMDLTWKRNQTIASNIANAETPGYRAVDVNFGSELEKAFSQDSSSLLKTSAQHMDVTGSSKSHLVENLSGETKSDGNNVDLDIEMGQLAYNRSKYALAATMVHKRFNLLSQAIKQSV